MGRKRRDGEDADIGPTPETSAKLEPDVARELFLCDRYPFHQHHWDAALDIRMIDAAIGRGMFPAFRPREGGHVGSFRQTDFLDLMTPREERVYLTIYAPWATAMGRRLAAVWDVVINNNWPNDDTLAVCMGGLQDYAERAGFCARAKIRKYA